MAQSGYTPVLLYASGTTGNTPSASNLTSSSSGAELALNYYDGKLFYKDNTGTVQVLATKGAGTVPGSNTQVIYNNNGALGASSVLTFDGTTLTSGAYTLSTGNLTFGSTSQKFLADFTNATVASRLLFQTSTANSTTGIYAVPSGTATAASWQATNAANPTNASKILIATNGTTDVQLVSGINGTGTYLPLSFYTNGSQQMRLDTSGNLGIGTSSPSVKLQLSGTSSGATLELFRLANTGSGASTASQMTFYAANSNYAQITGGYGASSPILTYNVASSGYQAWQNSGTEQMRLTSAGYLGIGTTSPNNLLTVNGIACIGGVLGSTPNVQIGSNGFGNYIQSINSAGIGANTFNFYQGGSIAYTLDIYGNLGLGVTPSAWTSVFKALQVGAKASLSYYNGTTYLSENFYNDGTGAKYITTDYASQYNQTGGQHQWNTAPSGTAGNAISFSTAMTLDNSGNLQLGTTTNPDSVRFRVYGISEIDGSGVGLLKFKSSGTIIGSAGQGNYVVSGGPSDGYGIQSATSLVFGSGGTTERARIDSSGNLGLGVAPSAWGSTNGGAFQFGSGYSSLYSYSNAVTIGSNVYYNAGNKYFASGVGSSCLLYTSPSPRD